jgi:hypothetical protein
VQLRSARGWCEKTSLRNPEATTEEVTLTTPIKTSLRNLEATTEEVTLTTPIPTRPEPFRLCSDLEIENYNEVEKCVNAFKIKSLIIYSRIDLTVGLPTIQDNKTPAQAVESPVSVFKTIETNEFLTALDDDNSSAALERIYDELVFKEKTDHYAKALLNHLRNEGDLDWAFESFSNFKEALLSMMREAREAVQQNATMINVDIAEMHSILAKMSSKQNRNDLLQHNPPLRNDRDRRPPQPQSARELSGGNKDRGRGRNVQPPPRTQTSMPKVDIALCDSRGIRTLRHNTECPFLVQKHPNANQSGKPNTV